ncbi:MAG: hypothetical protein ACLFPF_09055, partial [Halanaerobiales bacterium]
MQINKKNIKYLKIVTIAFSLIFFLSGCSAKLQGESSILEQVWFGVIDILVFSLFIFAIYQILLSIFRLKILRFLASVVLSAISIALSLVLVELSYVLYHGGSISQVLNSVMNYQDIIQLSNIRQFYNHLHGIVFSSNYLYYIVLLHIGLLAIIAYVFYLIARNSKYAEYSDSKDGKNSEDEKDTYEVSREVIEEQASTAGQVITDDIFTAEEKKIGTGQFGYSEDKKQKIQDKYVAGDKQSTGEDYIDRRNNKKSSSSQISSFSDNERQQKNEYTANKYDNTGRGDKEWRKSRRDSFSTKQEKNIEDKNVEDKNGEENTKLESGGVNKTRATGNLRSKREAHRRKFHLDASMEKQDKGSDTDELRTTSWRTEKPDEEKDNNLAGSTEQLNNKSDMESEELDISEVNNNKIDNIEEDYVSKLEVA